MKPKINLILIIISLLALVIFGVIMILDEGINSTAIELALIVFSILVGALSSPFLYQLTKKNYPSAYNIAIIGRPQTGKTTLITRLFEAIFKRKNKGLEIKLTSESTIERVNMDLMKLQSGQPLEPTKEIDVFLYKAELRVNSAWMTNTYQIQIGDFPGEDSLRFDEQYGGWFDRLPFFNWATSSDAIIFVIDVTCISEQIFVATISSRIRAAWQRLVTDNRNESRKPNERPIILVFTKMDTLFPNLSTTPLNPGISNPNISISTQEYQEQVAFVKEIFMDLITYLKGESKYFDCAFTSSFLSVESDYMGILSLLKAILPR